MLLWLSVVGVGLLATGLSGQEAEGLPSEGEQGFAPTVAYSPPSPSSQTFFTPSGELAPPPPNEVLTAPGVEEYAPSIENFVDAARAPPPAPDTGYGPPGYAPPPPLAAAPPPPPPPLLPQPLPLLPAYSPPPPTPTTGYGPPGYAPPPPFSAAPLPYPAPPPPQRVPLPPVYAQPPPGPSAPYHPGPPAFAPPPPAPPAPASTYGTPRADVLESLDEDPAPNSSRHRYILNDGTVVTNDYPREGKFRFSYLTPEGTSRTQIGETKVVREGAPPVVVFRGSYSYVAPDGTDVRVQYNADENGYTARLL